MNYRYDIYLIIANIPILFDDNDLYLLNTNILLICILSVNY